jgi:hypothetical protein
MLLDTDELPRDLRTEDRHADLPGGPVGTTWSTPWHGWTVVDHDQPRGAAVSHVPASGFRCAEMTLTGLTTDVPAPRQRTGRGHQSASAHLPQRPRPRPMLDHTHAVGRRSIALDETDDQPPKVTHNGQH